MTSSTDMIYRDAYKDFYQSPALLQRMDSMKSWQKIVKRAFDIVVSALGLVLLSPVFLIMWIVLRFQRIGSTIYKQERIGMGGRPFMIYKFRTMRDGAEKQGVPQLVESNDDKRITPVSRFLREHHLDELPQLWNVLRGDMSMVGPRPERQYFINKIMEYDSRYRYLYEIRPGVTSDATLHNGYTNNMEKMLKRLDQDLYYLENRSLAMDMRILIETAFDILLGKII